MNEFVWTFAVASVAFIAGYMMCALLSLDTRQKNERAVRRVREVHQAVVDDEDNPWQVAYATGWDEALQEVRRALDGGAE